MKRIIVLVIAFFSIFLCLLFIFKSKKNKIGDIKMNEYIPQQEISEVQNRMTVLTLYFVDLEKKEVIPEARSIDVKELMNSPYEKIMYLLIEGSNNSNIRKLIPDGTKINSINIQDGTIILDFDEKILSIPDEYKELLFESIDKTFVELKEISKVVISVNGVVIYWSFGVCFFIILDIFIASQILVQFDKKDSTSCREQSNLFSFFSL